MENQKQKTNSDNFIIYTGITVLVIGIAVLASLLEVNGDNSVFSNAKTKWAARKNTAPKPESVNTPV